MSQIYSNLNRGPQAAKQAHIDSAVAGGRMRAAYDVADVTGAADGSVVYMFRLPSIARLLPTSKMYFSALGTGVTAGVGLANAANVLVPAGESLSAAGSVGLMKAVAFEDHGKRVWEIADFSRDGGGEFDLRVTLSGAVSGADAKIAMEVYYVTD